MKNYKKILSSHRPFQFLLFLTTFLMIASACSQSPEAKLRQEISYQCAQQPVNWYMLERQALQFKSHSKNKLYRFGEKDQEFREQMEKHIETFVESGDDLDPKQTLKFVSKYLPNYVKTCTAFYEHFVKDCSQFEMGGSMFQQCAAEYDQVYDEMVAIYFGQAAVGRVPSSVNNQALVDVEQFDLEKMQKEYRKALMMGQ